MASLKQSVVAILDVAVTSCDAVTTTIGVLGMYAQNFSSETSMSIAAGKAAYKRELIADVAVRMDAATVKLATLATGPNAAQVQADVAELEKILAQY